jgi:oligopeptide transport system substrate-binding protein
MNVNSGLNAKDRWSRKGGTTVHRHLKRGIPVVLGVLLVAVIAAAGCSASASSSGDKSSPKPQKGGRLSYYIQEPAAIDPYNAYESEGIQVGQALFDSLTAIDAKTGKLVPAAADSWTSSADATVWTFKLHPGAKFADGESVTAADFVYAWNRIAESASKETTSPSEIAYHLARVQGYRDAQTKGTPMSGLKAVDKLTLKVTLAYPFAQWPYVCAHPGLAPVPKKLVEGGVPYDNGKVPYAEMPVGNGPFKMSAPWKHDQYIKVVRNDDYYRAKAFLDGVDFKIFKDENTAYREFQAGTLDFTEIPDGQIAAAKKAYGVSSDGYTAEPGKDVLLGPEAAVYFFSLDLKQAPLNNENVRRAISLAINRDAINKGVFEGTRKAATSMLPPGIPGYAEDQFAYSHYDVAAAKKMLASAGYPNGKGLPPIKIIYNSGAGHEKVVQFVQSDLKAIGVSTTSEGYEATKYYPLLSGTAYQMGRDGWQADYPIADNFTNPIFNSQSPDNHSHFASTVADADMRVARQTTNEAAREAIYANIQSKIGDGAPVVPIVYYAHRKVASKRVHDLDYDNMSMPHLEKAWLASDAASK